MASLVQDSEEAASGAVESTQGLVWAEESLARVVAQ